MRDPEWERQEMARIAAEKAAAEEKAEFRKQVIFSISFVCIIAFLFVWSGGPPKGSETHAQGEIEVSAPKETKEEDAYVFVNSRREEYYHLGDDMEFEYFCNGVSIKNGELIKLDGSKLNFSVRITERDSSPDIGESSVTMRNPEPGKSVSCMVHIDESNGRRYPDAYADYRVTFSLDPG